MNSLPILLAALLHTSLGAAVAAVAADSELPSSPVPVPIILDTDMAEDVDDAGALALLHALADHGEARILGVMISSRNEAVGPCVDAINTWYGRPDIPIGYQRGLRLGYGVPDTRDTPSRYAEEVAAAFPHDLRRSSDAPDAALLYRQILAAQPDHSVTVVTVGFLNNLKDLLDTRPDDLSPLDGESLVRQKVRLWVCMGGKFPDGRFDNGDGEYNVCRDTVASIRALHDWPTPVVLSGFEIGAQIKTGARLREVPEPNPIRLAYQRYNDLQPRESWDQTAVLFAVRGSRDLWTLSEPGLCLMHNRVPFGFNDWIPTPAGHHRYLRQKMAPDSVAAIIESLMLQRPRNPTSRAARHTLSIECVGGDRSSSLPCRIHLEDSEGRAIRAPDLPFWRDHFVCAGSVQLDLPPGTYRYAIERGPEYSTAQGTVEVTGIEPARVTARLRRLVHLADEGWFSGDLHVHRPLADIELLMRAEDLHVAPVITWWNGRGPWASNALPTELTHRFDEDRFYAPLAGEDERGGGALLYFDLPSPLPIEGLDRESPPSTRFLRMAKQNPHGWVEIEKPFWWDTPIWLATGLPDSIGICHNHMHRGGVLGNEAWGRPRDMARYPGSQGNGRYTQDLYYHVLNCGLRLPPSAGSASGVLPNPVGYNRTYVHIEGDLTWAKWWAGLRAGQVFVSNGPLLRARANGRLPGHVFQSQGPIIIDVEALLDSHDPIAAVELVRNGIVERIALPARFTVSKSGWFLVRAIADVDHTFRFASTGPWYVEIGERARPVHRESARFFLDWTRERRRAVSDAVTDPNLRSEALAPVDEALEFWEKRSLAR